MSGQVNERHKRHNELKQLLHPVFTGHMMCHSAVQEKPSASVHQHRWINSLFVSMEVNEPYLPLLWTGAFRVNDTCVKCKAIRVFGHILPRSKWV